ncbi:trypsin-like peptidase domain-containing protein [Muricoccus radiodurans]|uniref:trypsin-like peptidase domain-containing protein n=1 Tax=Muricoccus radiodurans TaxID=2231721 RepID=UPI003CF4368C
MIRAALALVALGLSGCAATAPSPIVRPVALPVPPAAPGAAGFRVEVRAGRAADCPLVGTAVRIGEGRFLTAAHIVDGTAMRMRNCGGPAMAPVIVADGRPAPARLVRQGEGELVPRVGPLYRRGEDLAVLEAPGAPPGPVARPCGLGPDRGQSVVVASRLRVLEARAGGMVPESSPAYGAYAEIPMRMEPGESGAGVFDAASLCLLGVVSHRPDETPGVTRIVPAAAIRRFLGTSGAGS